MIPSDLSHYYATHLFHRVNQIHQALTDCVFEQLVIDTGVSHRRFLDDTHYPFWLNPWAARLAPLKSFAESFIVIQSGAVKPKLLVYQPNDVWHGATLMDCPEVLQHFQVYTYAERAQILRALPDHKQVAYVGERTDLLAQAAINPSDLLNHLDYLQAAKTDYEIACMERANVLAAAGHKRVAELFWDGANEINMHLAYLQATESCENDLPYGNIIACNQHAAILHYTERDRSGKQPRNLLIDAGATYGGFCADISRSYCRDENSLFANLIRAMDTLQLELISQIKPGMNYVDLHKLAHIAIGKLLIEAEIIQSDLEQALDHQLVNVFFPHGLGHLLGAQVHDVGGLLANERGRQAPPPEQHPHLRLTRNIEANQVFTIEPGLYFIEQLLNKAHEEGLGKFINQPLVEELMPYGGIRIEDNVRVTAEGVDNLTRRAFDPAGFEAD